MTYGSFFTGIGGIDLGLDRAGWECRFQVEVDPFCVQVLKKHWPGVKRYGDIRKLRGDELERVDLLAGGFPCQDVSQAGKRTGFVHADGTPTRSGLWFEFARLVGELRPRLVLIENTPGLLVHDAMRRVVGNLAGLGYVGGWFCLRASEFGASHLRKRVFIVAYRESGRRGELRQPSREDGLAYGRGEELADTERAERRPNHERNEHAGGREQASSRPRSAGESVAHSRFAGQRRTEEPAGIDRQRPSGDDCGASGALEHSARDEQPRPQGEGGRVRRRRVREAGEQLADPGDGLVSQPGRRPQGRDGTRPAGEVLSDPGRSGLPDTEQTQLSGAQRHEEGRAVTELCGAPLRYAPGPGDPRWPEILRQRPDLAPALESPLCKLADGVPGDVDRAMTARTKRLSRLGNAVVPDKAEYIGLKLLELLSDLEGTR